MNDADEMHRLREAMCKQSRIEAEAIVKLAGFDVRHVWELANLYWPLATDYDDVRRPWWLFMTEIGPIRLGWRKRVIEIDWSACEARAVVTEDAVTKDETYVHAYSGEMAVEYMRALHLTTKRGES